jgi:hypothetical protein
MPSKLKPRGASITSISNRMDAISRQSEVLERYEFLLRRTKSDAARKLAEKIEKKHLRLTRVLWELEGQFAILNPLNEFECHRTLKEALKHINVIDFSHSVYCARCSKQVTLSVEAENCEPVRGDNGRGDAQHVAHLIKRVMAYYARQCQRGKLQSIHSFTPINARMAQRRGKSSRPSR